MGDYQRDQWIRQADAMATRMRAERDEEDGALWVAAVLAVCIGLGLGALLALCTLGLPRW